MPDEAPKEDADNNLSPEDHAFIEDLRKAGYVNPELYKDPPGLPRFYRLPIRSSLLPDSPTIIRIEIDGDVLRNALIEADFNLLSRSHEQIEGYGSFPEFRRGAEEAPEFLDLQKTQWRFVLRHFPLLFLDFYDITVLSSFATAWLSLWRENPDGDLNEFEKLVRGALEKQITTFLKQIKLIVETRTKGRPAGTKSQEEKAVEKVQEAREFENQIEEAIRSLLAPTGRMPTKTAVAKKLGIGGLNPKTGVDSSLNAFNSKLKRLGIVYSLIVGRVEVSK